MTLQALRRSRKLSAGPDNREQQHRMAVYGGTGEVAMNNGHIEILSVPLLAAATRAFTATV
jgi:hypothetical protein